MCLDFNKGNFFICAIIVYFIKEVLHTSIIKQNKKSVFISLSTRNNTISVNEFCNIK